MRQEEHQNGMLFTSTVAPSPLASSSHTHLSSYPAHAITLNPLSRQNANTSTVEISSEVKSKLSLPTTVAPSVRPTHVHPKYYVNSSEEEKRAFDVSGEFEENEGEGVNCNESRERDRE